MDIERLHEAIRRVAREEELELVVLFGSAARGAGEPRDLDVAVRGAGPIDPLALTNRLHRALGRSDVDLVDLRRADPLLLFVVAREGIPLYEAEPGTFARFHDLAARRYYDTAHFREAEHEELHDRLEALEATL